MAIKVNSAQTYAGLRSSSTSPSARRTRQSTTPFGRANGSRSMTPSLREEVDAPVIRESQSHACNPSYFVQGIDGLPGHDRARGYSARLLCVSTRSS